MFYTPSPQLSLKTLRKSPEFQFNLPLWLRRAATLAAAHAAEHGCHRAPPQHRRAFMRIVCPCDKSSFFRSRTGAFKLALMGLGEARRVSLESAGESERIGAAAGTLSPHAGPGRIRAPPLAGLNGSLAN